MISAQVIASSSISLDLELKIIRHFLLHPNVKEVRDAFIETEMAERTQSWNRYLAGKPDRDELDDLLAPSILRSQEKWLKENLHHLKEFSENRLNQMEIILRYTSFEGFLLKIIGNILWEYPDRRKKQIHERLKKKSDSKYNRYKKRLSSHPDSERIAWTIATVEAVDKLHFHEWKTEEATVDAIYLSDYIREVFELEFPQTDLWHKLEKLRRIRNHIIHTSMQFIVSNDAVKDAVVCLGNFPTLLVKAAAEPYPKACTEGPPEDGDDGTPGYELAQLYF